MFAAKQHLVKVTNCQLRVKGLFKLYFFFSSFTFFVLLFSGLFSFSRHFLTVTSWENFFKMGPEGKKLLNIIILGFGFMFMFTAFQTCGNIEVSASVNLSINQSINVLLRSHTPPWTKQTAVIEIGPTCLSVQQTVIKSFNSTEFHGSGYTR